MADMRAVSACVRRLGQAGKGWPSMSEGSPGFPGWFRVSHIHSKCHKHCMQRSCKLVWFSGKFFILLLKGVVTIFNIWTLSPVGIGISGNMF